MIHMRCSKCLEIIKMPSSGTGQTDSGSTLFAVNCKAAADYHNRVFLREIERSHANDDAEVRIVCEFHFGWDIRGSGFRYDGRGSVVGHNTKKILAWEAMSSTCRMCDRGHVQEDHDCRKKSSRQRQVDGTCFSCESCSE